MIIATVSAEAAGRTSPANLVLIETFAIPMGMSADGAFVTIAVIVDALGAKYFSRILTSPKVKSIGKSYRDTRFSSTPSLKLHLLLPSTMWGAFLALKFANALFTPARLVCGTIVASSVVGNVLMYVGSYQTFLIVVPSLVKY